MATDAYLDFLRAKAVVVPEFGITVEPGEVNPLLKPHQRDIVLWALRGGRRAIFAAFGLGKTLIQLEIARLLVKHCGGRFLIVMPLGVRQEFMRDAGLLGIEVRFIRSIDEAGETGICLTNYETVRDGKLDPKQFTGASLDEAAVLRGFGGTKTFREFMRLFDGLKYKFVATATPSPNEFIELLAYSAFLEVMDVGQAKTRFFKRNSEKADQLTIHEHKKAEFWMWCASWAIFLQRPSDLGHSDEGYELPGLDVYWHEIPTDHTDAGYETSGQGRLVKNAAIGVVDAAREKRDSLNRRIIKLSDLLITHGNTSGTEQGVLRGQQGTPAPGITGTVPQKQRSQEGLHEGVPEDLQAPAANEGKEGRTESETPREVCLGPGVQGKIQSASEELGQAESGAQADRQVAEQLHAGAGAICPDSCVPEGRLRDLRNERTGSARVCGGSRPLDGDSTGNSVSAMQLRPGSVSGFSCAPDEGRGVHSEQVVIWCDLNKEQASVDRTLDSLAISHSSLYGADSPEDREILLQDWRDRKKRAFVSKPQMYGAGVNLQQSAWEIFLGIGFKFNDFIQAIHRCYRFLQTKRVRIDLIYTEAEREVRRILEKKWQQHAELMSEMSAIIREYGLAEAAITSSLQRSIGVERAEASGTGWTLVNNDCVLETRRMADASVHLVLTSIPFSTQYEYTPSYNDFGHTDSNAHFWRQMDFLTPELFRVLKPGRLALIHVKDRVVPGGLNKLGFQTVYPFHVDAICHFAAHGFAYMGMKTILTDVVRENNQTYRLGWTEQCKDGTKMGVGMPEYLLLFRKPPSDTSNSYADEPVVKDKGSYSRSRWQVDAHGFARSSGDRLLSVEDLDGLKHDQIFKLFRDWTENNIYDYERHVALAESLECCPDCGHIHTGHKVCGACECVKPGGRLPVTFMLLQPASWSDDVWSDVTRMLSLNSAQSAAGREMHLCLARGSLVLTRERGWVPIQEVAVGDSVLTHQGRWRPVRIVRMTGVQPVITLRAQGVPGLALTPDHKLWTRKSDWVRERDGAERAIPEWVRADETVSGGYVNLKLPPIEECRLSEPELWLIGRWLADGHVGTRGDFFVSVGRDKLAEFERMAGAFAGARHEHTAVQIRLKGLRPALVGMLRKCGRGAEEKQVPAELLAAPQAEARALLNGYLSGDGYFLPERGRWMATSVSRPLLLGIAMLAQRVHGSIASLHAGRAAGITVIDGREVQTRQEWVLSFDAEPGRRKSQFILHDGAWKKVRSAEPSGEVETWCLRVDEDESFTAEGCIVKNCPMQFDIADRAITQHTMPGEAAEQKVSTPTLFDLLEQSA